MTSEYAEQLGTREAGFYQALLREVPQRGGLPDAAWLATAAAAHGLDPDMVLARLEEYDLIVRDPATGAIVSMYPFSGVPTSHRVTLTGGHPLYAMCAIDALGIPFMLEREAVIESVDPTTNAPIRVTVRGGRSAWDPPEAAVLTTAIEDAQGSKAESCCPVMNFFASAEAAEAYRAAHPEIAGRVLTQEEAVEHGRRYFGGLLSPDGPICGCTDESCEHVARFEGSDRLHGSA